jgi:vesicle-associated membrane protein 72
VPLQADKFHKTGKQLRSKMWWQNMRMKIIIVIAVLVLILVIFLLVRPR